MKAGRVASRVYIGVPIRSNNVFDTHACARASWAGQDGGSVSSLLEDELRRRGDRCCVRGERVRSLGVSFGVFAEPRKDLVVPAQRVKRVVHPVTLVLSLIHI